MPTAEKLALQDKIVEALPNLSMIDIARLVERLQDVVFHISWSLKIMLLLTLLVGFSVLFSIANQQAASRRWDIGLLKALGASGSAITRGLLLQFAIIATLAAAFGFLLSLVFSYVISRFLFNNVWFFDWTTPTLLLVSCVGATVVITWISIHRAITVEARDLLNR
jgi:putative ABC transport system permease protein